ncbi:MAG TPA: tyrosine-protein phosphatase [Candidatus Limnocylindria bacterium]|nr:tyrosine-protein phosphatase [Candidatus Limnocylindria bacterium]
MAVNANEATRALAWDACLNVRDLGGLTTVDGRRVRRAALVRSDQLCRLSDGGRTALLAHGVRTVIDLRTPAEVERDPDPIWHEHGVAYVLIPQQSEQLWREMDPVARTRTERDCIVIDRRAEHIAAMARAVAQAVPGGVLLHCLAGKDRTGIAVAMLLSLVGVDEADIASDYSLSMENLAAELAAALAAASDDEARARVERSFDARAETMLATLEHLRARHGGAEAYLTRAGLSDADVELIRARLLE